jgi:hypothetical protein
VTTSTKTESTASGVHLEIVHKRGEGYDLTDGNLYVEVKGSEKEKFNDFRPYFTLDELKKTIEKGKNYEIHILLGIDKSGKPKEYWVADGSIFSKYDEFVKDAEAFLKRWDKNLAEQLKPEVRVYLKNLKGFERV